MKKVFRNQKGFTLVEIIAVLILLGILAAVAIPKYVDLTTEAETRALAAVVAELNGQENLRWGQTKLSTAGWVDDATLFATMDTDYTPDFTWSVAATAAGGTIQYGTAGETRVLVRTASTTTSPGNWQ